jgi:hypothetical protein
MVYTTPYAVKQIYEQEMEAQAEYNVEYDDQEPQYTYEEPTEEYPYDEVPEYADYTPEEFSNSVDEEVGEIGSTGLTYTKPCRCNRQS